MLGYGHLIFVRKNDDTDGWRVRTSAALALALCGCSVAARADVVVYVATGSTWRYLPGV